MGAWKKLYAAKRPKPRKGRPKRLRTTGLRTTGPSLDGVVTGYFIIRALAGAAGREIASQKLTRGVVERVANNSPSELSRVCGDLRGAWGIVGAILRCAQNDDITATAEAEETAKAKGNGGRERRMRRARFARLRGTRWRADVYVGAEAPTHKANATAKAKGNGKWTG